MTFVSPCLLPMLPLYIAYFAGGDQSDTKTTLKKALLFVLGFSLVFMMFSLFVSTIGAFFLRQRQWVNSLAGVLMIVMGVDYLTGQKIMTRLMPHRKQSYLTNPFVFGLVFAISWTPCVGTFLASALTYIASVATSWSSFWLIVSYCLGLGLPFILSALLVEESKQVIQWVKLNYQKINMMSGVFLILFGLMTLVGFLEKLLLQLS